MSRIVELGCVDGRLCGELAAALARRLTPVESGRSGAKGAAFYHDSMTASEAATVALTGLDLLAPVPRDDMPGETWYCMHALTMDADDMPNVLAVALSDGDARLHGLLEAFLRVFCDCDYLSDWREPFAPPQHLVSSMAMLARAGYAERTGELFRWTALVGPTMLAAGRWDEDFASISEADARAFEADARLAWRTMPDTLRRLILSDRMGLVDMCKIVALGWRDGEWRSYRLDDWVVCRGGEIPLARRLFELAAGR